MKKMITLVTAGFFLLTLQTAGAQREVAPPAVPPMLEGQKPLAIPETKEPTAPSKTGEEKAKAAKTKAKGKAKASSKPKSKTATKHNGSKKKAPKVAKKKGVKGTKTKKPVAEPEAPATPGGPDEG